MGRSPVLVDHSFGVAIALQGFRDMLLLCVSVMLEGAEVQNSFEYKQRALLWTIVTYTFSLRAK